VPAPEKLLVVSHSVHYVHEGRLHAYAPYAREIDVWADLFDRVAIAAPCRFEPPPGQCVPFSRSNIAIVPQRETGGETAGAKLLQLVNVPGLVFSLGHAMSSADAIHVRCPGNLGLIGVVLAPLFSPYRVAKYAGQWNGFPREPWSVRVQRRLLASRWWGAPVTVYGEWPDQPSNVVPFFTSVLEERHVMRARAAVLSRRQGESLRILYVGRLSAAKNVDVLVSAVGVLAARNIRARAVIVGDGPTREALERQVASAGLTDRISFTGGVPFEQVLAHYESADALVLASETEGWPKAIAEGMAFGLVCVGSNRGIIPAMLSDGRGLVVPPGDTDALVSALSAIAAEPERSSAMGRRAAEWAQQYSLERVRESLRSLCARTWGVSMKALPCGAAAMGLDA
jgi:glycosyltransferase involved in cell wall biosynthesis